MDLRTWEKFCNNFDLLFMRQQKTWTLEIYGVLVSGRNLWNSRRIESDRYNSEKEWNALRSLLKKQRSTVEIANMQLKRV